MIFTVSENALFKVTAECPAVAGHSDSGTLHDGANTIYSWSGTTTTAIPIPLLTGHNYAVIYDSIFQTLGGGHGTQFTDSFAGSFDAHVSPVPTPEPVTILAGCLVWTAFARRKRSRRA